MDNNRYLQLQRILEDLRSDFSKLYVDHNKSAGTRIRKGMQELKNLAQEIRIEVQKIKNEPKT